MNLNKINYGIGSNYFILLISNKEIIIIKMKMTDLWNKYLKEDFPKKIETLLEIAKKDNILEEEINQEIRSNLNSFKVN